MHAVATPSQRFRAGRFGAAVLLWACMHGAAAIEAPPVPVLREAADVALITQAERAGKTVALPETLTAQPEGAGIEGHWSFAFATPAQRSGWVLYLSGVRGHVRITLNGQALLDTITTPLAPVPRGASRLRLLDLPPYLLHDGSPNRVEITLRGPNSVSLSQARVGAQDALAAMRDTKTLWMIYGPAVVATLIASLGLSVLLIWVRRRQEALYGYFGVASVAWGLHTAWSVSPREVLPGVHGVVWWTTLYAFLVGMLSIFCLRFSTGRSNPRLERGLWMALPALPLLLYASSALGWHDQADAAVRLALVCGVFIALGVVAREAWQRRNLDNALLLLAGGVAASFGLRDWLVSEFGSDQLPVTITAYASLPFVALLTWFLIDRFVRTNSSLELLNRELETRVASQSAALVSALDRMRAAKDWAEKASRSKTGFLAAASHDLRQPLHALGLYMSALRQRTTDPAAREIVERMDNSVGALDSLLDSLLDISRIDAGALVPRPAAFDLAALLRRLGDEFAPDAAARGVRLSTRIGGDGRARAWSDPLLVERLLRNLVANAVKYTRRGGVLVTCRARHDAAGAALWRVEVWDTGPGIAPEEQERVFEEFYQAGNPERDRRAGLGLGLSIVRRLAQLLKLPLALHSVPGRGTRFVVVLPATDAQAQEPIVQAEPASLRGLCVAVIEDDPEVRSAMRALLSGWGCQVRDGADADELLRRDFGNAPPQALVADLRLRGGRDGIAEAERLRRVFGDALQVLLVSGDTAPERVRLMASSGLPWLAKPVAAARLRAWLGQVRLAHEQPERARASPP
jgi:signal transduction histidine kinase/CheY-like chemotaxis protein